MAFNIRTKVFGLMACSLMEIKSSMTDVRRNFTLAMILMQAILWLLV
jgi:hypothetical protein